MPKTLTLCAALTIAAFTAIAATPAQAVTSVTVIITDDGAPLPKASVSVVDTATGTVVDPATGAEGGCGIAYTLGEGTYHVLVGGFTVKTFAVDGNGSKQVGLDVARGFEPGCGPGIRARSDNGGGPHDGNGDS